MVNIQSREKARVMLDANVLIAGTIWPRWQYAILQHALLGDFRLVLAPLIIEAARRHILDIDAKQLSRFERFLADCSFELVDNPTREEVLKNRRLVRSFADVPIALAAINSKVDFFVTYDRDFTDEDETTEKIRQALPGIMMPPVFLRNVMGWTSEELEEIRARGC
ncbi:PIN domain-containing protein [Candidatus Poribacteria bacterium]|nr:PIN domain-containing protein [Candidatus Poribacteria bacterium]